MLQALHHRHAHYGLLLAACGVLFLANLGGPSLWDVDEGHNASAAREMMEAGNWIVPTFNYQLRVDKPALLYWCQIAAYSLVGVGELGARLPSAMAAMLAVLLTYELGRRLFDRPTGLLGGIILASTILFAAVAHFANPDALLNVFTILPLFCFWHSFAHRQRLAFVSMGIGCGLAVLAKGPVGLVLPGTVIVAFLAWSRQLGRLLDRRLALGIVAFGLVALPWYVLVGVDTKGEFLRGFLFTHNVNRFQAPMEGHRGPIFYYLAVLLVGFAPWSIFLGLSAWYGTGERARTDGEDGFARYRFLWCWIGVYLVFFTLAGTKLPNYIAPLFPPTALLTARFLERWRRGLIHPAGWVVRLCLACLMLTGLVTAGGLLLASGIVPAAFLRGRAFAGLQGWAALGMVPVGGALAAGWYFRARQRTAFVTAVAVCAIIYVAGLAGGGAAALEPEKAPRALIDLLPENRNQTDMRLGSFEYFQPSLVFYAGREVVRFTEEDKAVEFLSWPAPVYLFVPLKTWERMAPSAPASVRVLGTRRDLYRNAEVVLVTNVAE